MELLGEQFAPGIFYRKINKGEAFATGIHMFHEASKLLFSVKFYASGKERNSLSLSSRDSLFADEDSWIAFKEKVHQLFKEFRPVNGGSGPQKREIPFFISSTMESVAYTDAEVETRLRELAEFIGLNQDAENQ